MRREPPHRTGKEAGKQRRQRVLYAGSTKRVGARERGEQTVQENGISGKTYSILHRRIFSASSLTSGFCNTRSLIAPFDSLFGFPEYGSPNIDASRKASWHSPIVDQYMIGKRLFVKYCIFSLVAV
jgi:hypothetical protein